jgi:dCTP deaminase
MAFWSGQTLKARAKAEGLIDPFDPALVSCSAYELKVGGEAFITRDKADQSLEISQGRTPGHLVPGANESICIPSGQFAFLITAEKVRIPDDSIGLISMKASKKWQGLVNVSGFHVDPGWNDRLIYGVFNAGPQTLIIKPGEPFFLLFYARLDEPAEPDFRYKNGYDFSHIPSRLMQGMSTSVPTVYKLNDNVKELREDAKSAQNRSNISLALGGAAISLAIASISIAVAVFAKTLSQPVVQPSQGAVSAPAAVAPTIPNIGAPGTTGTPAPTSPPSATAAAPPTQHLSPKDPAPIVKP